MSTLFCPESMLYNLQRGLKGRNINNIFSLNTVGHVFDEYIKI